MQKLSIGPLDEGQRLDKFLSKYLKEADKGFLYRMLRKKNITLNGKKAEGAERLMRGDEICFFFSDETFAKFRGREDAPVKKAPEGDPSRVKAVYEDTQLIFMNKPAGLLSQKAGAEDLSLCEHLAAYLAAKGEATSEGFTVGVANRLDRNTSGLVMAGKTLPGQQLLALLLRSRGLEKYYLCLVKGRLEEPLHSRLYWKKDTESNTAAISDSPSEGALPVELILRTEEELPGGFSLLRVQLLTGKSHQIRAQLAHLGLPVVGDGKYGDEAVNRELAGRLGLPLRHQLLHAYQIVFPDVLPEGAALSAAAEEEWKKLAGRRFTAPLPVHFERVLSLLGR